MNWDKDKSIALSKICVLGFMLLLAGLDLGGYWIFGHFARLRGMAWQLGAGIYAAVLLGSVFGWICLVKLWTLLMALSRGEVFSLANAARMRSVSWCCVGAGLVSLGAAALYLPFLVVAFAAAFMALIVRIVKNCFQQAALMKAELDYTI